MWEEAARAAAGDAAGKLGAAGLLTELDALRIVFSQSWDYDDPARRLAERLGAEHADGRYSGLGGSVPQMLLAELATDIVAGKLDVALVVGGEALATLRRLEKEGRRPEWSHRSAERHPFPFDLPLHPAEVAHGIYQAYLTFSIFDSARRAHLGRTLDEHRDRIGRLLAPMSAVAAADPANAWFPTEHSATELIEPSRSNRMVAFPYTKLEVAVMDVDMTAAVIIASDGAADRIGVPREQRVYLRGWGYAEDPHHVAGRRDLWRSVAMSVASRHALDRAGIGARDVAHMDLYSCFASSLSFAIDALGLDHDAVIAGHRPVTVTGGLPYHGGPGSNYMTHAIAALVETLRRDPGSFGLASGVGMHMARHAFGVYSTVPGRVFPPDPAAIAAEMAKELETTPITDAVFGPTEATVAAYSVVHGRDGGPEWAALVCDLDDGSRCYARIEDPDAIAAAEHEELIGQVVHLEPADGRVNRAAL